VTKRGGFNALEDDSAGQAQQVVTTILPW